MDDLDWFLNEDLGKKGDITSDALFTDEKANAVIIAKEDGIVAGLQEAAAVFQKTGAEATLLVEDGAAMSKGKQVLHIKGLVRSILSGERLALNIIGRMSGIASQTRILVEQCRAINPNVTITGTRKTTPGFRAFEKKAIILGGGQAHRFGLYDEVLIKDNHLKIVGSVEEAIRRVKKKVKDTTIEVEVENQEDAVAAAKMNVDVIMLDNLSAQQGEAIAHKIRQVNDRVLIEVSGGITPDNIQRYAHFADKISLGCLTHSVKSKDFSLEIFKN